MGKLAISCLLASALLAMVALETEAQNGDNGEKIKARIGELVGELRQAGPSVRGEAEDELAKIGKPAVPLLIEALKEKNVNVRCASAYALGEIADASAVPPLMELLGEADAGVRAEAAWALGKIADAKAGEALKKLMQTDADKKVQVCGAFGSAAIAKDREALDFIIKSLGDGDEDVRFRAAWASGLLGDQRTGEPLKKGWTKEKKKSAKVAFAFGMVMVPRDGGALDFILESLSVRDAAVKRHVQRALALIIKARVGELQSGGRDSRQKAALDLCKIGDTGLEDEVCVLTSPILKAEDKVTREFAVFTFG